MTPDVLGTGVSAIRLRIIRIKNYRRQQKAPNFRPALQS
jgi:hypothetical protein